MIGEWRGDNFFKYEKESSKLRMGGESWTINYDYLGGKEPNMIIYESETHIYSIPYSVAKIRGFDRVFQGEKKLVVPVKNWKVSEK